MTLPNGIRVATALLTAILTTAILTGGFGVAVADVGVSISPGEMAVPDSAQAGQEAAIAPLQVGNPGDQPATYRIVAQGLNEGPTQPAEPDWFVITPATLELAPGQTAEVAVSIQPGSDATAGRYAAMIQAELQPRGSATQIVAVAATKVFFDVASDDGDSGTWWWWVLIALLAASALVAVKVVKR